MSKENIKALLAEHLTTAVIGDGQMGLANMIHEKMLTNEDDKPLYVCTDFTRGNFAYKNQKGEVERDGKATKLSQALVEADLGTICVDTLKQDLVNDDSKLQAYLPMAVEISMLNKNNSKFRTQLACVVSRKEMMSNEDKENNENDMIS